MEGDNDISTALSGLKLESSPSPTPPTSPTIPPPRRIDTSAMDQVHKRAIEALQPFIHLANSNSATSPRFVAQIVTNATSHPNTYAFGELLETPTIQSLRAPDTPNEHQGHLKLLEIFAWGTWQDYQGTPNLPTLSAEQANKLRLLTLITYATKPKPLTYATLQAALDLATAGDLEALITTAIYNGLLVARLSPSITLPSLNVTSVAPLRDPAPAVLPGMVAKLSAWEARCGEIARDLEAQTQAVKANTKKRQAKEKEFEQQFKQRVNEHQAESQSQGGASRSGKGKKGKGKAAAKREAEDIEEDDGLVDAGDGMDIDEGAGAGRSTGAGGNRTKRVLGERQI
ncbi:uncharacterized protein N7483_012913 [Penicillium malachiteum]|uniref:uncharacterized protein n=1 Tax=Penicillium malachiteum TaxID=1324776 RepID=UPI0025467A4C|nr:uncharacterized protein N7483_012913 [Penicillium malachiteum]KAJ5715732.1 hypothetical protein N7483_012913 [Penicillium malachiteum]